MRHADDMRRRMLDTLYFAECRHACALAGQLRYVILRCALLRSLLMLRSAAPSARIRYSTPPT